MNEINENKQITIEHLLTGALEVGTMFRTIKYGVEHVLQLQSVDDEFVHCIRVGRDMLNQSEYMMHISQDTYTCGEFFHQFGLEPLPKKLIPIYEQLFASIKAVMSSTTIGMDEDETIRQGVII